MTDLVRYLMIREGLSHRMYWYIKNPVPVPYCGREREREREIPTAVDSSYTLHRTATLSSLSVSVWTRAPPAQSRHSFNSGLILGNNIVKYLQPIVVHYSAVQSCVGLSVRERERERERETTPWCGNVEAGGCREQPLSPSLTSRHLSLSSLWCPPCLCSDKKSLAMMKSSQSEMLLVAQKAFVAPLVPGDISNKQRMRYVLLWRLQKPAEVRW